MNYNSYRKEVESYLGGKRELDKLKQYNSVLYNEVKNHMHKFVVQDGNYSGQNVRQAFEENDRLFNQLIEDIKK